jgi:hypothetical protein
MFRDLSLLKLKNSDIYRWRETFKTKKVVSDHPISVLRCLV